MLSSLVAFCGLPHSRASASLEEGCACNFGDERIRSPGIILPDVACLLCVSEEDAVVVEDGPKEEIPGAILLQSAMEEDSGIFC